MPGRRGAADKTETVQFRVPSEDLDRWRALVKTRRGYLSVLIRQAVDEWIELHKNDKGDKATQFWEWPPQRRYGRY